MPTEILDNSQRFLGTGLTGPCLELGKVSFLQWRIWKVCKWLCKAAGYLANLGPWPEAGVEMPDEDSCRWAGTRILEDPAPWWTQEL